MSRGPSFDKSSFHGLARGLFKLLNKSFMASILAGPEDAEDAAV